MAVISLAELKAYLNITSSSDDVFLQTIVDGTNAFLKTYLNRELEETEYEEELYDGTGTNALCLKNYPVSEVAEVMVDEEEVTERTGIGEDGYYLNADAGILYNDDLWERGRGIITVTYTAGYETIPADIKMATLELASYFRNTARKSGVVSESLGSYSYRIANDLGSMGSELTIPSIIVKNVLDRYRKAYHSEIVY